jgi:hypothetical protein
MENMYRNTAERFWNNVNKTDTCWLWKGATVGRGYGKTSFGGICKRAHRVAWELTNGVIPEGLLVCHRCDNPLCVRPDHLFLGTSDDNNKDMQRKGRSATGDRSRSRTHPESLPRGDNHYAHLHPELVLRGERHGNAKLTEVQIQEIRTAYASQDHPSYAELSLRYGVSSNAIWSVVMRKTWQHV